MRLGRLVAAVCATAMMMCTVAYADSPELMQEDFVHAEGTSIIGTDGKEILIKSMALGNDVFANPSEPVLTHHDEDTYRELADMGFNCVRYYLNYELFEDDSAPFVYKEAGFEWLDKNVEWAKKHGIGIVFNMHCPQGGYQSQGNGSALWTDKSNQDRLTALWRTIAERYADEPTVWGYAVINEPYLTVTDSIESAVEQCRELMDRIADEIREVSPYQAIFAETAPMLKYTDDAWADASQYYEHPLYFTLDDDNVVYEFHYYRPFAFTHQDADWANTAGAVATYPARRIESAEYESYWVDCKAGVPVRSEGGWTYFETNAVSVSDRYNIAYPVVGSYNIGAHSFVYVDDIRLVEIAPDGTNTVLSEYTFATDESAAFSAWSSNGTGSFEYSELYGGCIKFGGATENFNISSGMHFEMREGYTYKVTGRVRGEGADVRIDFAKADNILHWDKKMIDSVIFEYHDFSQAYNVPVYMGEFGVIRSGFDQGRGGTQWVSDVIDVCYKYNVSFNYHAYHEAAFGLYYKGDVLPDDSFKNNGLAAMFRLKLRDSISLCSVFKLLRSIIAG